MSNMIQGNCLDVLKTYQDNAFAMTITSPPYNMNLRIKRGKYVSRKAEKNFITHKYMLDEVGNATFNDDLMPDDYFNFHKSVIEELLRVTEGYIFYNIQLVTGNKVSVFKLLGHFAEHIKEVIIWDKVNGQPAMLSGVMNSTYEFIFIFHKDRLNAMARQFNQVNFERGKLNNIWRFHSQESKTLLNSYGKKEHRATFPNKLVSEILDNFYIKQENSKPIKDSRLTQNVVSPLILRG